MGRDPPAVIKAEAATQPNSDCSPHQPMSVIECDPTLDPQQYCGFALYPNLPNLLCASHREGATADLRGAADPRPYPPASTAREPCVPRAPVPLPLRQPPPVCSCPPELSVLSYPPTEMQSGLRAGFRRSFVRVTRTTLQFCRSLESGVFAWRLRRSYSLLAGDVCPQGFYSFLGGGLGPCSPGFFSVMKTLFSADNPKCSL
eukprot:EG_transcript_16730